MGSFSIWHWLIVLLIVVMVFVLFMIALVSLLDLGFGRLVFEVFAPDGA